MDLLFILNVSLGFAAIIYLYIHRKLQYWKNLNVPHVDPKFLFGNAKGLGRTISFTAFCKGIYMKLKPLGPAGGFYIFTQPLLMVTDLDLVKQILVKDFHVFHNRGRYYNAKHDPLSANLVNLEDDDWKNLRHKLTPTFTSGKIKMMFDLVSQKADKLIETIDTETKNSANALEAKNIFSRFTIDVIGSTAFGIESNTLEDITNKFLQIGLKAFAPVGFLKRILTTSFPNLSRNLGITAIDKKVSDFYLDVVQKTIHNRQENPEIQRNDFMNLLMKLQDPSQENPLTFNQIAAQSFVFFTAGFETSSLTLTYCLYELSQNKKLQEKARQTVQRTIKKHENVITFEAVSEMEYLEQCVNETLRKYPPLAFLVRVAKKDYKIPNTQMCLKQGTMVIISNYAIHHDPENYPQPEKFDPDRFSKEEVEKRHSFSFLPFGEGPRMCIGLRFALVEIKTALAKLLVTYAFDLDRTQTSVPLKISTKKIAFMSPVEGVFINFTRIKASNS